MIQANLAKKTKAEIIADYEKLQASLEDSKGAVRTLFSPKNEEIINQAKTDLTNDQAREAVKKLKASLAEKLNDFSQAMNLSLGQMLDQVNGQVEKFSQLQKAVELSADKLKTEHQIELTAETLEKLMSEFEDRRRQLEAEISAKEKELENEIEARRNKWAREQEEYEYDLGLKRKREEDEYAFERVRQERELAEREAAVRAKEDKFVQMEKAAEELPGVIEKQVTQKEQETRKSIEAAYKQKYDKLYY